MNATLQCFCHIRKFVNFFKYHQQAIDFAREDKNKLSSSFKLLMEKLWPNDYDIFSNNNPNKYFAPEEFKNKISKMNPLFQGFAAYDAKNLVFFIIMTLHKELNKGNKNNNINNNININQTNPQIFFNSFVQNFMLENKSIISDLFFGINCSITQCHGCGTQTNNYQTYFSIVFPLEEVLKFKHNNNQFNFIYNNNNCVTIFDCFDYDKKIVNMSGINSMYCNYCKRNCDTSIYTVLTTGPEVLILFLDKEKGNEFNMKIIFFEQLNLFNYIQNNNTGFNYKLIGVIINIGESGMGGHFIAYCSDLLFGGWYKYDDANVTLVTDFQNEAINYFIPSLLFYQKTN